VDRPRRHCWRLWPARRCRLRRFPSRVSQNLNHSAITKLVGFGLIPAEISPTTTKNRSGTLAGQFVQTVLHVNVENTLPEPPFDVATAIVEDFSGIGGGFADLWCDCLPSDYTATSLRARRILATGGPSAIALGSLWSTSTGQRTGTISSAQVNPVIIWIPTTLPSKTGRTFLPGVSEADIDEMVYDPSLLAAISVFGNFWAAGGTLSLGSIAWTGAIYRRALAAAHGITNYRISPVVGTQRRRLRPV